MAVVQGNKALASDYNILRTEVNRWFADNYAGSISFGNSNQTYGWGGSAVPAVNQGDAMLASQMNALIDRCNIGEDICNVVSGQLSQIVAGNNILASEFNAIETKSDSITTNRLDIESAEMAIATQGSTIRTTTWNTLMQCIFRYTFSSFDQARYFFNSGGAFTFYGSISGYSTGTGWDGAGFNEIFTNMGTVTMNYTQTVQSGSGGTPSSIGFYDLTGAHQQIFSQTGTGAYSDAILRIYALFNTTSNYVDIRFDLIPGAGRSVNGTTTVTTQRRKLIDQSSGAASLTIASPTYSLVQPF